MTDYTGVRYEALDDGTIARITMSRPEVRNAQDRRMLAELNDAFTRASLDDKVRVIILAGDGPHFSSGHDLKDHLAWAENPDDVTGGFAVRPVGIEGGFSLPGAEGYLAYEQEIYFRMCRRWHDLPKPTIAQVHGKAIAGGLMVMWVCDLIVASEDALFSDPTVGFGVNGVEWFSHPWELGVRKAKELLFTGDFITAEEARQLGMVNQVVAPADLEAYTEDLARRIARKPSFALRLAKMAVNQALDAQGFWTAQQAAFNLQHLGHADIREAAERAAGVDETEH
ncbi:enoyl-CoA hydratase [Georgenia ruanii]|uniref:Enoyl-CoA hydratase n=1 Tax=Georgenia ruanii TaxID=348442 RepID=A0A7J9V0R9_9MICO|nr:enoyl-CoA hydratase [Georgenia ruanii]MPV90479.1 enoyl-CoA hydratase [Georgenia ruanii]